MAWLRGEFHRANARDEYRLRLDEGFPARLVADAERYLGRLAQGEDGPDDDLHGEGKGRPAGPPTPRRQLEMAVTALIASGVPREEIWTLRDLVVPIRRPVAILRFPLERTRRRLEGAAEWDGSRSALPTGVGRRLHAFGEDAAVGAHRLPCSGPP